MATVSIRAPKGANKKKVIVGRGRSSGSGKTAGKGHKGQKARSGGGTKPGFEGGQMPIFRRVAGRGFSNHPFKTDFIVINVGMLDKVYKNGDKVTHETLVEKGLVKKSEWVVKILGNGELTKKLDVQIPYFSQSAKAKIEKAGGSVIALKEEATKEQ